MLDPLSKAAQVVSPYLVYLTQTTATRVRVYLNPAVNLEEMPLKRFYRTVLPAAGGGPQQSASFQGLPAAPLLTLGMHVPSAWMVQVVESAHDLDNIHLESIASRTVSAHFRLEHLLVEGACIEAGTSSPVAGLELQLGTERGGPAFDTIVMANLGYLQLKALPGVWQLRTRAGRSTQIFAFAEAPAGADSHSSLEAPTVALASFTGAYVRVSMARRPGMKSAQLLGEEALPDAPEPEEGSWGAL